MCVRGDRQRGAKEPSAKEKNLDLLKKGKPSDRAGMQAVIRIASTSLDSKRTGKLVAHAAWWPLA